MKPVENSSPSRLRPMFDQIAESYDRVNRLFTLGLDRHWRRRAVRRCLQHGPKRVLDLCTGTGELVRELARACAKEVDIVAADFSPGMLERARQKLDRDGLLGRVRLVEADAARLPFDDGSFDAVTVGFALRNLLFRHADGHRHLEEIHRVLRPGGQLLAVESGQPRSILWRALVHAYVRGVVAPMGLLISRRGGPYRYLAQSATGFYREEELRQMLQRAGFEKIAYEPLCGGAAALLTAGRGYRR